MSKKSDIPSSTSSSNPPEKIPSCLSAATPPSVKEQFRTGINELVQITATYTIALAVSVYAMRHGNFFGHDDFDIYLQKVVAGAAAMGSLATWIWNMYAISLRLPIQHVFTLPLRERLLWFPSFFAGICMLMAWVICAIGTVRSFGA